MQKRYLCFFTVFFSAALGVSVLDLFHENRWIPISIGFIAVVLIGFLLRNPYLSCFCAMGICAAGIIYCGFSSLLVTPIEELDGVTQTIYAEVCDYPEYFDDVQRVEIRVDADLSDITYPKRKFSSLIYLPNTCEALKPGDQLTVQTTFYIPNESEGFDRKTYQNAQGRFIQASSTGFDENPIIKLDPCSEIPMRYFPLKLSEKWKADFLENFDPSIGGFMSSLILGDRSELSDADYTNLKKSGLSHIVAVSGMHLTCLVAFITCVLGKKIGSVISIPVIILFACMVGNTPSVMRASIMAIAAAISFLIMDNLDPLTILSFSLLVLLLHNPYAIANTSLQLSYLSTLGLMLYAAPVKQYLDRPFSGLPAKAKALISMGTTAVSCSLCAVLFTAPVLLFTFGYISLISSFSNLLVIGAVSITFVCGLLFCIMPILHGILIPVITILASYILKIAEICSRIWWFVLDLNDRYAKPIVFLALIIIVIILCAKYTRPKFTLPVLCVILGICIHLHISDVYATVKTTVHAVGNGQMITVADGRKSLHLIDCGSGSNRDAAQILKEYMLWNDFTEIDSMILTAVDKTHARAFSQIASNYPINHIVIPAGLQENEFTNSVLSEIDQLDIPCTIWNAAGESGYDAFPVPCSLIGGIDRKLGVRLETNEGEILILHSYTQKMLQKLLATTPLESDMLIWSAANVDDLKLLESSLRTIAPQCIIFPSGGDYMASRIFDIPTRNTYTEGNILFRSDGKMV